MSIFWSGADSANTQLVLQPCLAHPTKPWGPGQPKFQAKVLLNVISSIVALNFTQQLVVWGPANAQYAGQLIDVIRSRENCTASYQLGHNAANGPSFKKIFQYNTRAKIKV